MKVLFATPEIAPWVKTGGLGDVAGALPPALRQAGVDLRVLVPYYPALRIAFPEDKALEVVALGDFGGTFADATLRIARTSNGIPLMLLDCPEYYDRDGNPYLGPDGADWPDNHLRFGLLSRVAAWLGSSANHLPWRPDIVHCHDWQTGLAPAYLKLLPDARARSLITVHNLAFQGLFGPHTLPELALPAHAWGVDGVEFYGHLSFLKAGLIYADAITTVSPTYAVEIQTDEEGMGMAGLLRHRAEELSGIINGIDTEVWNPARDAHIPFAYDIDSIAAKKQNKAALQREVGLAVRDDLPLLGVVSRLTHQKGLDLIAAIERQLAALPAQLVVLGNGDKALEAEFRLLAERHPGQFAVRIGFNESLAHRIEAGADIFLMPSRFEPCGLNQMYSLRYGTPPVVRATGGLADTVVDGVNGFVFREASAEALLAAIRRAAASWRDRKAWQAMQITGMRSDVGWAKPAAQYAALYGKLAQ
ncbi:MAG: glycogen synthase GlgA [Gammaproteobacteria bacterium]|nr:glycogen synthase GlgA [Gammaproteobacteria bacterium]MBU1416454.1 glycogen synthase GlgA [Gammaproteobacteria bacterium]